MRGRTPFAPINADIKGSPSVLGIGGNATPAAPVITVAAVSPAAPKAGDVLSADVSMTGTPWPSLALAWEKSTDGTTWTAATAPVTAVLGERYQVTATASNGVGSNATLLSAATPATAPSPSISPDIVLVGYGQSNWGQVTGATSGATPAAAAGTLWWDGSAWSTPPAADGVRNILNEIRAATGLTVGMVSHHVSGVPISFLADPASGSGLDQLKAKIAASGGRAHYVLWHQGEGDSANNTAQATYHASLQSIHDAIATAAGKTRAQLPLIVSGLGICTAVEGTGGYGTSITWDKQQKTLLAVEGALTNAYYSHSNQDATLTDNVHMDGASAGRSGQRYAETIKWLRGIISTRPRVSIASATYVSGTATDVVVAHSAGSDFLPTSGITGFEVSVDGATWTSATGVRQSATTIRLTHADMGAQPVVAHQVRYLYGMNPSNTGMVKDNSALAVPVLGSYGNVQRLSPVATPAHTWDTPSTDDTPTFTVTGVQSGDTVNLQYGTATDFSGAASVSGTASGTSISFTLPTLANGTYQTRVKTTRGGVDSFWSPTVQAAISTAAAKSYSYRSGGTTTSGSSPTSHTVDIGAASASRIVVVAFTQQNPVAGSVVVNGVTLTPVAVNTAVQNIFYGVVPTGDGNVTLSMTSQVFTRRSFSVWTVQGVSTTPKVSGEATGSGLAVLPFSVDAGDFLFVTSRAPGTLPTGSTEVPDGYRTELASTGAHHAGDWVIDAPHASFTHGTDGAGGRTSVGIVFA